MTYLLKAGLELIVIGGGHNNCYPIIRAAATHSGRTNPLGAFHIRHLRFLNPFM